TAHMAVRVPPAMSHGLFVGIAEVAAMSDLVFRKRFRSSYDSSPSPILLVRKRNKGMFGLILDTDSDENDEVQESLDSDSESEDAEDEGPTAEDEDPAVRDEGLAAGDEDPGIGVESHGFDDKGHSVESNRFGLGEEEALPEGQQRAVSVWSSGLFPISPSPSIDPSPIPSHMISLTVPSPIASPVATLTATILVDKDQFIEVGAQLELYRSIIQDHTQRLDTMPPTLFAEIDRDHEQERTTVTFRALWRPVLALEAWAGHRFAVRAAGDERTCYCVGAGEGPVSPVGCITGKFGNANSDRIVVTSRTGSDFHPGMDIKSEPFEGEAETPESPHIVAPPICHIEESKGSSTSGVRSTSSDSIAPLSSDHPLIHTTPALVPILRRTARMAVRVPPAMSHGLFVGIAEVAAMSDSVFRKRFRSSYDSSPSPILLVRKRNKGMFGLMLDTDSDENDEVQESLDSDSESEDAEDEGPTAEDEDPAARDEGLAAGDEDPGIGVESHGLDEKGHSVESNRFGLGEKEALPEGQQRAVPVVGTAVNEPLRLGPVLALEAWAGHRFAVRAAGDERTCYCVGAGEGPGANRTAIDCEWSRGILERVKGRARIVGPSKVYSGILSKCRVSPVGCITGKFGNANSDRIVVTSRTGSYPDTLLR
nr:hypothetical protein [Tanacetum cinerariifolium]